MVHFAIGMISLYLSSSRDDVGIGLVVCLYHIAVAYFLLRQDHLMPRITHFACSDNILWVWILSFLLQIVLGHYLFEGNAPTFVELPSGAPSGVSAQAVWFSVLLALCS
jgi:hypothetical protein